MRGPTDNCLLYLFDLLHFFLSVLPFCLIDKIELRYFFSFLFCFLFVLFCFCFCFLFVCLFVCFSILIVTCADYLLW